MKIYIATPVNARLEPTMAEKLTGAKERIEKLKPLLREHCLRRHHVEPELVSTFDVNPIHCSRTEAEAMGNCIRLLLECDTIAIDYATPESKESIGMYVEVDVALAYRKNIIRLLKSEKDGKESLVEGRD